MPFRNKSITYSDDMQGIDETTNHPRKGDLDIFSDIQTLPPSNRLLTKQSVVILHPLGSGINSKI